MTKKNSHSQHIIEMDKISKRFGKLVVLDEVDLNFNYGETTTVIGKSGVGKSVMLKVIMGLLDPDSGELYFEGKTVSQMNKKDRRELKNKMSYMFQNMALFDSMTVFENIAMPLVERAELPYLKIKDLVMEKIEQLDLKTIPEKYPSQISGGMKKRVALARALITEPDIILFDEPTTGLDPIRCRSVLDMIEQYRQKFNYTAIIVSHNIPLVFSISHRVLMLNDAKIIFDGTSEELCASVDPVISEFVSPKGMELEIK